MGFTVHRHRTESTPAPLARGSTGSGRPSAGSPLPALQPLTLRERVQWTVQALASLIGLVILSPVMIAIAVAIKLTSRGPVFYRGQRVGRGERLFTIYKFRTLSVAAEQQIGGRLLQEQDRAAYGTRIGRLLKRSKLDELPQLLNVVRGEMRLVGPRPLRPIFLGRFKREIPGYAKRFQVPPGLTGVAQLRGGYYTSPRNKLRYDLVYVRHRSLLLDLQLVLLTLLRLGDRWLRTGFWIVFLFLFVSFTPQTLQSKLYVTVAGFKLRLVLLLILAIAACALWRPNRTRISFSRGPLNVATVLFLVATLLSAACSSDPYRSLEGAGYYLVTGFLWSLVIVNALSPGGFSTIIVRVIALTSVTMAVLGLGDVVSLLATDSFASGGPMPVEHSSLRATAILHNPTVLALFLVLGIPLLFAEVSRARTQRQRDFWLVCSTLSLLAVLFTQSRIGFVALLAAGTFFFLRRPSQAIFFATLCLCSVLLLGWFGAPRFSLERISREAASWAGTQGPLLGAVSAREWLVGGQPTTSTLTLFDPAAVKVPQGPKILDMHVTLALEHGVAAWLVMAWLFVAALRAMKNAHDRMTDERARVSLWAIMSCLVGFVVAMLGTNALHNLVLQIYFWSLLGIGLWTVTVAERRQGLRLVWRFGDPGD